jgi:hypothetical protein
VAFANFQASLISAEANLLNREAALRNVLGLPPTVPARIIPVTPPSSERLPIDWDFIVDLAEERRPDLLQLKLIIESDVAQLRQAENFALPSVDAVALQRFNGLEGRTPTGDRIGTSGDQFTDWTLGINVTVPLGLRQSRAVLRRQELLLARDRANLDLGLHNTIHILAANTRNLDQFYEQYLAFRQVREAAEINLEVQSKKFGSGLSIFLNVLQAITDWGNSVSAEAQSLAQYNSELANLERETGTILETHGVELYEDQFSSRGPCFKDRCYPLSIFPGDNSERYPTSDEPAENFFNLKEYKFDSDEPLPGLKPPLPIPPPTGLKPLLPNTPMNPKPAEAQKPSGPASKPKVKPMGNPIQPEKPQESAWQSAPEFDWSLVTQGIDGIQPAGAAGGIEPKKHAHRSGE